MKRLLKVLAVIAALLVIAFLFLRTPDTDKAEMRAKYGGEPSQFVTLANGQEVHLRDEGPRDGVPIILLHGSAADLHTWQPWIDGLADTYRVIRLDQIGHGLTGPDPQGDYSIENFVAHIDEVADVLGLESFILGGNSMGGYHTLRYSLAHPERVQGMILVDAGGPPAQREVGGNIGFTIAKTPIVNQLMKHITPRSMVERSLRQSVSNQDIVTEAAIDRYWELLRYPGNRAATIVRFTGERARLTEAEMARLTMPALIIWGEEDALIPVAAGEWLDRNLPTSTFITYPGIGHLPQEEAADQSVTDLRNWLGKILASTPVQDAAG